ncbi:MAG: hypothetical protein NDI84_15530 [Steroidobacteraceae bacterium]|nr:hypothetical protein [Steroidobacteraceae bacterium]
MSRSIRMSFDRTPHALPYMIRALRPVRRRRCLQPDIVVRWTGHRADRAQLGAFRQLTGLPDEPMLPMLYPHTVGFRLAMVLLTHPAFPVPIWGVLQVRNHLRQYRPIHEAARMDFETRVVAGRPVAKGAEFDLQTVVDVAGERAWQSLVTFFAHGRFGEPAPVAAPAAAPAGRAPVIAEWTMQDAGHWRCGRLTGDYNGIHLWDAYARRFGFARALYHPPRVIGECLARLPDCQHDVPASLDVWLKGPVPHGARVALRAGTPDDPGAFALHVEDARPCILGRWRRLRADDE